MKKNILHIVILILGYLIFAGCNANKISQEEVEILSDSFATKIRRFAPLLDSQEEGRNYVPTINLILKDVRANLKIKESRDGIIKLAKNISSDSVFSKLQHESKTLGVFIKSNLADFEAGKMSLIKEYYFVEQLFSAYYWKNWKDLGFGFETIIHSMDTMLLYELEKYHIPISIDIGKNNYSPYWIKSNSLQKKDKDKIYLRTQKAQDKVFKKEFEVLGYNILTGEKFKKIDSILYRIVKKETDQEY